MNIIHFCNILLKFFNHSHLGGCLL